MKKLQFLILFLPILVYAQNNPCINNTSDTSYTNITCNSYTWNDSTYTQSGTYSSNTVSSQ